MTMVDAVDALVNRVSSPRLAGSVPADVLHEMVLAAARAPEHAQLKRRRGQLERHAAEGRRQHAAAAT